MASTITSANSIFTLAIVPVYPVPQQLQGYAADAAFDTESVDPVEIKVGVDGNMSAGFRPFATPQTIMIMADSPSNAVFDAWLAAMKAANEVFFATGAIQLPSVGKKYALTQGVLSKVVQIAPAKQMLEARSFTITWQSIDVAPF